MDSIKIISRIIIPTTILIITMPMLCSLLITIAISLAITTSTITRGLIMLVQLEFKQAITSLVLIQILLGTITITRTCRYPSTTRAITTSWIALLTKIMYPFQVKACSLMRNQLRRTTITYGIITIIPPIRITFGAVNLNNNNNNSSHSLIHLRLRTIISGHNSSSRTSSQ